MRHALVVATPPSTNARTSQSHGDRNPPRFKGIFAASDPLVDCVLVEGEGKAATGFASSIGGSSFNVGATPEVARRSSRLIRVNAPTSLIAMPAVFVASASAVPNARALG